MAELVLVSSQSADDALAYRVSPATAFEGRDPRCRECDYDRHECYGCGASVTHDQGRICLKCNNLQ